MKKYVIILLLNIVISIISLIQAEDKNTCTLINKTKTIEDFELIREKDEGTRFKGGVFREKKSDNVYLIKYSPLTDSIPEYISGEILAYILHPDRVGQYEYIWDQNQNTYAIGSPWLPHFKPFETFLEIYFNHLLTNNTITETDLEELLSCFPHGCNIINDNIIQKLEKEYPSMIDGKLLTGFDELIIASIFINDQDFNPSNIGYITKDNQLIGAKVDHGETLKQLDSPITLADIRKKMCMLGYWKWELNFQETLDALKKIATLDNLDEIIKSAVEYINQYVDISKWYISLNQNNEQLYTITDIKKHLKYLFKIRQLYFQQIAESLEIEMAIKNNDLEKVKNLITQGIPCDMKINSFFNWIPPTGFLSSSKAENYILNKEISEICRQDEPITILEYAKKVGANEIVDYLETCISNLTYASY